MSNLLGNHIWYEWPKCIDQSTRSYMQLLHSHSRNWILLESFGHSIGWNDFMLEMSDMPFVSKSKNWSLQSWKPHAIRIKSVVQKPFGSIKYDSIAYNLQFSIMKYEETEQKKNWKKQAAKINTTTPQTIVYWNWSKQYTNCCNLKRINPKAVYCIVIALHSISINMDEKMK